MIIPFYQLSADTPGESALRDLCYTAEPHTELARLAETLVEQFQGIGDTHAENIEELKSDHEEELTAAREDHREEEERLQDRIEELEDHIAGIVTEVQQRYPKFTTERSILGDPAVLDVPFGYFSAHHGTMLCRDTYEQEIAAKVRALVADGVTYRQISKVLDIVRTKAEKNVPRASLMRRFREHKKIRIESIPENERTLLLDLELRGVIKQHPGKVFELLEET